MLLRTLSLLAGFLLAAAASGTELTPIEHFFENPVTSGAVLSPNAKFVAVRSGAKGRREALAVIDLVNNTAKAIAFFGDADIGNFHWISDERLIFDTADRQSGAGDVRHAPGLYAVNRDGSALKQLATRYGSRITEMRSAAARPLMNWNTHMLRQRGAQDSEFVYVAQRTGETTADLYRLNTLNGRNTDVTSPGRVFSWMLDHKGEPRIAIGAERDTQIIYYRDPVTGKWRTLAEQPLYKGSNKGFTPLAFGPDGTLYVAAYEGKDKSAVYTYNLATDKLNPEPLIVTEGYDFQGGLVTSKDRLLGMRFLTDAESTMWFDPKMKAVQEAVDAALPGTVNMVSVAARAEMPWVLVESYSDTQPRRFALFNTETKTLNKVGESYPQIKPAQMATQEVVRYKARDGLDIPGWLTLPPGGARKDLPLVVLVHGGPWVRGKWGWHPETQFLASRGYAVLEPEFRGSTGFGNHHLLAGFKQWGLAMQNDVADGAKWAIAQGIADPKRICIAGASYGGYATLMGLINDPTLFKCGVDWVGVTDIKLMYTGTWISQSDASQQWKDYGMPEMIGDPVKDAAQLAATSPLNLAARITQPLLLAYGGADRRVPIYHGQKFYDAVKQTNKDVEWVVYPEEGHGWALPKNRIDFWTRVEKFLDRNIGEKATVVVK